MSSYLRIFQSKIKKPTIWLAGIMVGVVIAVCSMPRIRDTIFMWFFFPRLSVTLMKDSLTQEKHPREYFPPLYPGIEWQQVKNDNMSFVSQISKGSVLKRGYRFESKGLADYPNDFVAYYEKELNKRGWVELRRLEKHYGGTLYIYSKIKNLDYIKLYSEGIVTESTEHHFEFGIDPPRRSKYPGHYQAYVEYSDPDIQK